LLITTYANLNLLHMCNALFLSEAVEGVSINFLFLSHVRVTFPTNLTTFCN
jgi:hypothetical protein